MALLNKPIERVYIGVPLILTPMLTNKQLEN